MVNAVVRPAFNMIYKSKGILLKADSYWYQKSVLYDKQYKQLKVPNVL